VTAVRAHPDEIRATGRVVELMRDGACRIELPNGHRCVGQSRNQTFAIGDPVTIAFHPYDLSRGWIVEKSA
jgi:translation initiation factor IF-1